jgi:hypothetical protein
MKRTILGLVLALCLVLGTIGVMGATTTTDINWDGAGELEIGFVSGNDATASLYTGGNAINGEFHGIDYNDNPYAYNVDTTDVKLKSNVVGGGVIQYLFERTNSFSGYGLAGQQSGTEILTDGTGAFAWHTNSNYASLGNGNYGWQSDNQMTATGVHSIDHFLSNGVNGAEIQVAAVGSTQITDMCDSTWGAGYSFGKGCGCYTNANVNVVGTGTFDLTAISGGTIATDFGITTDSFLNVNSVFGSGFHFANFALTG